MKKKMKTNEKRNKVHVLLRRVQTTYLPVFIKNVTIETVSVGEALGSGTFSDADNSVLFRMKYTSLR